MADGGIMPQSVADCFSSTDPRYGFELSSDGKQLVWNRPSTATGIKLEPEVLNLQMGDEPAALAIAPMPAGSQFDEPLTVSWKSSDTRVAAVVNGRVVPKAIGSATITAETKVLGLPVSATCTVSVSEGVRPLTGLILNASRLNLSIGEKRVVRVTPVPANAELPAAIGFALSAGSEAVASLVTNADGRTATLTAIGAGVATLAATATAPGGPVSATCTVNVSAAPQEVRITAMPDDSRLVPGDTATLTATVLPAGAVQSVEWRSSNPAVAAVAMKTAVRAEVTALAEGDTVIYATTLDGKVSNYYKLTVQMRDEGITLSQSRMVLLNGAPGQLQAVLGNPAMRLGYAIYQAEDYEMVATASDIVTMDDSAAPAGDVKTLTLTPKPGVEGRYILVVYSKANPDVYQDEVYLDIASPAVGNTDYPKYRLETTKVAISKRQALNTNLVSLSLWPDAGAGHPVSLLTPNVSIRFKGGAANPKNDFFAFEVVDENHVALQLKKIDGIAKSYKDSLEIVIPGIAEPLAVPGTLSVTVNTSKPKLKAAAVNINAFYDDLTAEVVITGGEVVRLETVPGGATAGKKTGAQLSASAPYTVTVIGAEKKASDTLKLRAMLAGWGDGDPGKAENWYAVSLKVNRSFKQPGLKLSSSTMKVYAILDRAKPNTLTLKPSSAKDTLAALGVRGVEVDPARAGAYGVVNGSFNALTGEFQIETKTTELAAMKGKIPLLVTVDGSARKAKVTVNASVVSATTAIKLKAGKTSIALNPNLATGERVSLPLTTNVAGFDLAAWHASMPLGIKVFDNAEKGAAKTDMNGLPGKPAVTLNDTASELIISIVGGADAGRTYKVQLTLPQVNTSKGKPVDSVLNLTVKTVKKSTTTNPAARGYYGPKATLSVKGNVDLTTGASATITAKFTNYNGGLRSVPKFDIIDPRGTKWSSIGPEYGAFDIRRVSDSSWTVSLREGRELLPGSYKFALFMGDINGTDTVSSKPVKLTVKASKPKVVITPKTVTLHANDLMHRTSVTLEVPTAIQLMSLKGAHNSDGSLKQSYPFYAMIRGNGVIDIMLDPRKPATTLANAHKTKTITFEYRLLGDLSHKVYTAKVKVNVLKWT